MADDRKVFGTWVKRINPFTMASLLILLYSAPVSVQAGFTILRQSGNTYTRHAVTDTPTQKSAAADTISQKHSTPAKKDFPPPTRFVSTLMLISAILSILCLAAAIATGLYALLFGWFVFGFGAVLGNPHGLKKEKLARSAWYGQRLGTGSLSVILIPFAAAMVVVMGIVGFVNLFRKKGKKKDIWGRTIRAK